MADYCKNAEGLGAAKPKTGMNRTALSRPKGMSTTVTAFQSKTRSRHHNSEKHYHYEGVSGYGSNENIKGYG